MGRGFLSGKLRDLDELADDDFRRSTPRFDEDNFARNLKLVDRLDEIAAAKGCTTAQLALAWVALQGCDVVPIPGTTNPDRVEENAAALNVALSAVDLDTLDRLMAPSSVAGTRYSAEAMQLVGA